MKLTLPWPPSINTYWRRHGHIMHVSKAGKQFQHAVRSIVGHKPEAKQGRLAVSIVAYPPDRRTRDLDNSLKSLCDSLTKAGVWIDDEQIDDLRIVRGPVEKPGRVEVTIETIGD